MKQADNLSAFSFLTHGFYDATDSAQVPHPILMNQVHSADALFITQSPEQAPQVDALITTTPGLRLTVKTADCAPILMVAPKCQMIAAIHAGWRGALQGIIESTLLEMVKRGAELSDIRAAVGPHIQQPSFEMGADIAALFPKTESTYLTPHHDKYLFDFDGYVRHRLMRAGITSISSDGDDTYTNPRYFSYRRDPSNPARQFSSIMLLPLPE